MGAVKEKFTLKNILAILAAIAITLIIFLLQDEISKLKGLGYIGVFVTSLLGNATMILPAPSLALVFVSGAALGSPLLVGLAAGLGSTIGELTGFLLGFGSSTAIHQTRFYKKIESYVHQYGLWLIFILALVPNPLFDFAGIAAGAAGVKLWKFMTVTFLGKTIKALLFAYAGNYSL